MMKKNDVIRSVFRMLKDHRPFHLMLILLLTLFLGTGAGFSIVLLIPLLQLLSPDAQSSPQGTALYFNQLAEKWHLNISIEFILLVFVV